jgi:hypothetical protein
MVLSTKEALELLAAGHRIRPTYWPSRFYLQLWDGKIVDNDFEVTDFVSTHQYVRWETPVEHSGRKYLYQEVGELHWHETPTFFASDEEFKKHYPGVINFLSLRSSEVSHG